MLVRPVMTNLKMTVRDDCAASACKLPYSVYKSSPPQPPLVVGGVVGAGGKSAFGHMSATLP